MTSILFWRRPALHCLGGDLLNTVLAATCSLILFWRELNEELWRPYRTRGWHNYHAVYHSATRADSRVIFARETSACVGMTGKYSGRLGRRPTRQGVPARIWVRVYPGAHLGIHLRGLMGGDLLRRDFQAAYDELGDGPGVEHGAAQHRRHPQPCRALFLFLCLSFVSHTHSLSLPPPPFLSVCLLRSGTTVIHSPARHPRARTRTDKHACIYASTHAPAHEPTRQNAQTVTGCSPGTKE
jgi:hypothetical protein